MAASAAYGNPAPDEKPSFWDALKWTAQFLGIVGGGGSGFAALSFGIGYLAIKNHDAMLGLPTPSIPYTAYVRTGALFFTTAIQSLVTVLTPSFWGGVILAALFILVLFVGGVSHKRSAGQVLAPRTQAILLAVASVIVLVASIRLLPLHAAPLEPMNRDLLFVKQAPTSDEQSTSAFQVWQQLRNDDGEKWLQKRFGLLCASVFGLIYMGWMFSRWRKRLSGTSGDPDLVVSYCLIVSDWVVRPLMIAVALIMLAMLPANYGVLALSNHYPCVVLWVTATEAQIAGVVPLPPGKAPAPPSQPAAKEEETKTPPGEASAGGKKSETSEAPAKTAPEATRSSGGSAPSAPTLVHVLSGYLISDLTAEPPDIIVLRNDPSGQKMTLHLYKREAIRRIEVSDCGPKSILAILK